ncbi:hypothetical protein fugu_009483 [Takifugu bimaculatus]|uniref:Uncharacterized protein n=1 Tax=Takifugu bimaculatus TaxID=433685 RepID=A0A4Z2CCU8_9TELE|nr:hypothetical protein fugu_009483 [Takifugu bimaculatus]
MPCRKENYIFLEQSVTVDSKEVDALVTRIGEALQLHGGGGGHQKTVSVSVSCLHGLTGSSSAGIKQANSSAAGVGSEARRLLHAPEEPTTPVEPQGEPVQHPRI